MTKEDIQAKLEKFRQDNPELYVEPVHCRRCNRPLTHPDSIQKGIGPECEQLEGDESNDN